MQEVSTDMHSRHHAVGRTYVYRIVCPVSVHQLSIFELNRCWAVEKDLDLDAMREAAEHLKGTQDFSSFRGAGVLCPLPGHESYVLLASTVSCDSAPFLWCHGCELRREWRRSAEMVIGRAQATLCCRAEVPCRLNGLRAT